MSAERRVILGLLLALAGACPPRDARAAGWAILPNERLCAPRQFHTATLIGSNADFAGAVLIVGGLDDQNHPTASVELYNPQGSAPHLTQCASLARPRAYHTATWVRVSVADGGTRGMVLIVGGYGSCTNGPDCDPSGMLNTYELYDPSVNCNSIQSCADCNCMPGTDVELQLPDKVPRAEHTATVLGTNLDASGPVIIAGGSLLPASQVLRFETDGSWSVLLAAVPPLFGHTATYVTPPPGSSDTSPLVFLAGGSTTPVGASDPAYADADVVLGPPWSAPLAVPHEADAGTNGSRPARSSSASLVKSGRVFLLGREHPDRGRGDRLRAVLQRRWRADWYRRRSRPGDALHAQQRGRRHAGDSRAAWRGLGRRLAPEHRLHDRH